MKKAVFLSLLTISILMSSCVSKKKFTEVKKERDSTEVELLKMKTAKEKYKDKYSDIQGKVDDYYSKINSLQEDNDKKLERVEDVGAVSENDKKAMRQTLENVDDDKLAQAETLSDSIDLAVGYNLTKSFNEGDKDGIDINVNETVVHITVSDDLLFKSGSAWVHPDAHKLLKKIAEIVNSEPAMEVLVEGHTDDQTMVEESYMEDNWDLSVRRATSIVRILQDEYSVEGKQLIAAGRSKYHPLAENSTQEGREKNRRTKIVILPNLDKFLAMLDETK